MTDASVTLLGGDCLDVLRTLPDASVHSIVTDPPYGLGFMGMGWDHGVPSVDVWSACLRVLKPGGHLLSFFGTRTYHRGVVAIEDAGFEIRDQIGWAFGSGFPKSRDISMAIDQEAGAEREVVGPNRFWTINGKSNLHVYGRATRPPATVPATDAAREWDGWGTGLKPAWEPIVIARKPFPGTVAANVLTHGTGGMNIDGCRVAVTEHVVQDDQQGAKAGRFPANLIHDGSREVLDLFPETSATGPYCEQDNALKDYGDLGGSAARYFYCAKASKSDRGDGNNHPTVKPTDLMRYLCRLVTPPGGVVLDPFMGSGSTGKGARLEGFGFIGIEREPDYLAIARNRIPA